MNFRKWISLVRQYDALERRFRRDYSDQVLSVTIAYLNANLSPDGAVDPMLAKDVAVFLRREYVGKIPPISFDEGGKAIAPPYKQAGG